MKTLKRPSPDLILTPSECASYHEAIADLVCWVSGYKAAGGTFEYVNMARIQSLKQKLQEKMI